MNNDGTTLQEAWHVYAEFNILWGQEVGWIEENSFNSQIQLPVFFSVGQLSS